MHTQKLFETDSYLKQAESKILHTKGNIAVFEKTIFYAESGGQPGDIGEIVSDSGEVIKILDTTYDEKKYICHHLEKQIANPKGIFQLKINWARRYQLMKMHSLMHIICSFIDADITGCAVGVEKSRMDFDLKEHTINKEQVTIDLNNIIEKGAKIHYEYWDKNVLSQNPNLVRTVKVFPPSYQGKYRIVNIEGIDIQPCGGTHVQNIAEIGKVAITKIKKKGASNRRIYIEFD